MNSHRYIITCVSCNCNQESLSLPFSNVGQLLYKNSRSIFQNDTANKQVTCNSICNTQVCEFSTNLYKFNPLSFMITAASPFFQLLNLYKWNVIYYYSWSKMKKSYSVLPPWFNYFNAIISILLPSLLYACFLLVYLIFLHF